MPLIKCPNCGRDISDKAKNCIGCGYVLTINSFGGNVVHSDDSNQNISSQPITPVYVQQQNTSVSVVSEADSKNNLISGEQNNGTKLTQEKILAFTRLMQDGIITSDDLAKIISALSSSVSSNYMPEKTPLERKYDECFSKYIINAFKSPSTCKWPKLESNMIVKGSIKINSVVTQCTYIDTYIDAANSYGTMLRQKIRLVLNDQGNITRALQELQTSGVTLLGAIAYAANKDNWTDIVHFKGII